MIDGIDYGPLAQLIGTWTGRRGLDVAPDNQAQEDKTPYFDELVFSAAGVAENAEEQELVALRYRHLVRKSENGQIFHDQIGHWMYEPKTEVIIHSLSIPRGVCVLAGGKFVEDSNESIFEVRADCDSNTFGVVQSPFMLEKAKTKAFHMLMKVNGDKLNYKETTSLHIYGKDFEHTDESALQRVKYEVD